MRVLLSYAVGGGLLEPGHRDNGSVLSMSVLLSDPEADGVTGGQFVTWTNGVCCRNMHRDDLSSAHCEKRARAHTHLQAYTPTRCRLLIMANIAAAQEPVVHLMRKGDALLFHSGKAHNVAVVTGGMRHSLVIELWVGGTNVKDRES